MTKERPLRVEEQRGRPWKPHRYQKRALKFVLERPNSALFLDPG